MTIMKYFTVAELCKSTIADKYGIKNIPNAIETQNLIKLIENILDPLRAKMGCPIIVSSGFRCKTLNSKVGGSKTSQHMSGQAADIYCIKKVNGKTLVDTTKTRKLFDTIVAMGLPFDQLILEKGTQTNPQWIHVSHKWNGTNRKQKLYWNGRKYITVK